MPYAETPEGLKWVDDRRASEVQDQVRRAAETLATDVETYLYDEHSHVWMKPEFLAWAIARYDVNKTGSGNYAQTQVDFDHDEAVLQPIPLPRDRVNPAAQADIALRYPEHARQSKNVDTDEKKAKS